MYEVRESKQGQTVDALALGGDEGRDKLRKSSGGGAIAHDPGISEWATRQAEGLSSRKEANGELKHLVPIGGENKQ